MYQCSTLLHSHSYIQTKGQFDAINRFCGWNSDTSKCSKRNSNTHKYSQYILFINLKHNTQIWNKKPIHNLKIKATLRNIILDIRTELSYIVIERYIYDIISNDDICEDIPNHFLWHLWQVGCVGIPTTEPIYCLKLSLSLDIGLSLEQSRALIHWYLMYVDCQENRYFRQEGIIK